MKDVPTREKISAIMAAGEPPLARKCPWPRCVLVILSSSYRCAQMPAATASWPMVRCTPPGSEPVCVSALRRSSMRRISSMRCSNASRRRVALKGPP